MSPDINSLSPTRSTSSSPRQHRPPPTLSDPLSSPHSQPGLLSSALANMDHAPLNNHHNAIATELPHRPSQNHRSSMPGSERRRSAAGSSSILNNGNNSASDSAPGEPPLTPHEHRSSLGHNGLHTSSPYNNTGANPTVATGDPHHQRAPSLGELHQELEQEQEAQVNRLLHMIRSQQAQLQHLQQQQQHSQAVVDDSGPPSERLTPFPPIPPLPTTSSRASTQLPSSLSSRRPSRPSSQAASPNLRPLIDPSSGPEGPDWTAGIGESTFRRGSRDESAFYQAEAAMLTRENHMLRQRIRELERQVRELASGARSSEIPAAPTVQGIETVDQQASTEVGSANESSDKT
ncbi:uncharacterized protein BO80DRAFT_238389 [Aspergillus ibericus CBS 121593]|uniref:BZIP domain-containing protein n=1 Tax=Aspergillus ibericus CBS 121593 TaxID=1448316 RepID=A0A395GLH9_9EURO|nr:hypothetical protein BO80DRAFT_238389 [Aspergillus ibericus CBS 121593]RAK96244.1 hypothetical protein BO80DRAFT_238389 [Aspergillus ibericus CBS 121593]